MHKNNKILLVDDEPKNLKILKIRLEKDHELKEASSGEEALALVKSYQPALVLLDIMMEGIDGYEVTKKIKENPQTKMTKVILISGKAMIEEKLEGYHAGAEDYISKPFNGEELRAKVDVFLKLYNLEKELQEINQKLENEVQIRSEQLMKSERMAYVGMHSAEIVHNLKNPLAIIKGYLFKLKKESPNSMDIQKMDVAADKILNIIKSILTSFSYDIKNDMKEFSINDVIKEEVEFLATVDSTYKHLIQTQLDLNSNKTIYASKLHFSQILGNIIKNSVEAMESTEKKELRIKTIDQGDSVIVQINDSGTGIAEDDIDKIYQPLYTTKYDKEGRLIGNGLGLAFCKKMMENYNGELNLSSTVGAGTEVLLKIPVKSSLTSEHAA